MQNSQHQLYVSPQGNDRWSGKLAEPNAERTDGPFATPGKARDVIRAARRQGELAGPVTVWLRGGRYPLTAPLTFTPDDAWPVTYAAYASEQPVLDGARRITGWRTAEVNGRTAWVVDLPDVTAGKWHFRSLFVNGDRRSRPRLPKITEGSDGRDDFYRMAAVPNIHFDASSTVDLFDGYDRFTAELGQFEPWHNLADIEVVVAHYWIEERMPVAAFDPATREVVSTRYSMFALKDDFRARYAKYYVDNVFEALTEPGEWYLDRAAGRLYYLPLTGETPDATEVYAPVTDQLLVLTGDAANHRYVEHLRFEGLTFEHADWRELEVPVEPDTGMPATRKYAASPQAASHVPGALSLTAARYCTIEDCTIRHAGYYGIELAGGCSGIRIIGNDISDLGAGGVKVNGADALGPVALRTGHNRITDNHIHDGGRVYHSGIGVFLKHAFGNLVSHNDIHDFYYSGISCGWVWGFTENISADNRFEANHIHHLGKAWLSDMGGIYTLGVQPGTVIRGNWIHDVEKANYGGWAVYLDEGSSHIVVEANLCYRTTSQPFHMHYGREATVRNNVFAFGGEGQIALGRSGDHLSFTFERNIVLTDGQPIFIGGYGCDFSRRDIISDLNLFWDLTGEPLLTGPRQSGRTQPVPGLSLAEWQAKGNDLHSLVADPLFRDVAACDFTLALDSPAFALGFQPVDVSGAGPRAKGERL